MKLEEKLAEWREAGVIDADTALRIAAHEQRAQKRPYLLYAVSGLGAASIAIGLVSIVASNWETIPAGLKLALDLALLLGLAVAIRRSRLGGFVAEVLLFVFYGAVLASIGLVSQVYHLGGKTEDALLFWSLITAPIVLFGTTRALAAVWLVAAEAVAAAQVVRVLDRSWHRVEEIIALTTALLLSLGLIGLGRWTAFRAQKPAFASVAAVLGRVQMVAIATLVPLAWYEYSSATAAPALAVVCLAGVVAGAIALVLRDEGSAPARPWLLALAVVTPLVSYAPLMVTHGGDSGFPAAASFLLMWSLVGVAAYRLGRIRLLDVATALIGVRLLIIYFEVFGSLLDTGVGLLSGGVLTVVLAYLWVKKARRWSSAPRSGPGGAHG